MATLPIVNTRDKRIGIISAVVLVILTLLFLYLMKYEIPNPLPTMKKVQTVAQIDQIVLKDLKVEGGAGGGTPNNAKEADPKPTRQEAITNTSKPSKTTTTTGGKGTTTNSNNTTNTSGGNESSNPFGDGGTGGGQGGGNGPGFGEDSGEGKGTGNGIGFGSKNRTRLNNVNVHDISIETDARIYYKLTVDNKGNVVAFSHQASNTTTTNLNLINKIGVAIKKQVKYSEAPGAPLEYQFYTINVRAT
ncbi:MAG: hypothetical protein AB8B56_03695 [Crocinitomicaceae bacterium]